MEEIVVQGSRLQTLVVSLINLGFVGWNGWAWAHGTGTKATPFFTILPAVLVVMSLGSLIRPPTFRLGPGGFQAAPLFSFSFTTPADNIEEFHYVDGKVCVRLRDLSKIEGSQAAKQYLQKSGAKGHFHLQWPMKGRAEEFERMRAALFRGRAP